ncbi:MAG TPA: tol-pal system protein YbgF [Steroidobacteraceae bacterium]|nr:tol-pal system protein YbgF [Steroidobacteraceae bacterium]
MSGRPIGLAMLMLVATAAATPAAAQSRGERIESLESRMQAVERQLESQALLEMARQLESQDAELRRLRGELERLQHELERIRGQQRDQYLDLDTRLRAAEAALAAAQSAPPAAGPEAEYQAAFNLLKDGKYPEATAALGEFIARHRDHELASNALYWLGEAHYVQRNFQAALAAFDGVLKEFPGARKTPDALLKAGYCQYELKRHDAARATLTRLAQEFPESPAAAEAATRLERMKAEGR